MASAAPAQRVNSREAVYTRVDGQNVTGWLAWPAGAETEGMKDGQGFHIRYSFAKRLDKPLHDLRSPGFNIIPCHPMSKQSLFRMVPQHSIVQVCQA